MPEGCRWGWVLGGSGEQNSLQRPFHPTSPFAFPQGPDAMPPHLIDSSLVCSWKGAVALPASPLTIVWHLVLACCLVYSPSGFMLHDVVCQSQRHHGGTMSTSSLAERRQLNAWRKLPRLASSGRRHQRQAGTLGHCEVGNASHTPHTPRPRRWILRAPRCRPPILRDPSLDVLRQLPFHGIHAPIARNLLGPAQTILGMPPSLVRRVGHAVLI